MMTQSCAYSVLSEIRSNKLILSPLSQIQSQLAQKTSQLTDFQKSGKYSEALKCKQNIQKLKKELQDKKIYDLAIKHKKQRKKLEKNMQDELTQLTSIWTKKISQIACESQKYLKEMEAKHQAQMNKTRTELETEIPNKIRDSSQCLNLKKMEQQMVKQQKYAEADIVKQKITELKKKETQIFQKQRQAKIEASLATLIAKHKTEKEALIKKNKHNESQVLKDKEKEIARIKHKNDNILKELKSQQEKQLLTAKGQIKSKVTVSAVKSLTKISFKQNQ